MLNKNDFVEIEYTGKIKNTNEIFDTNVKEEAKKINLDIKAKPLIICIGQNMILQSIDDFLVGKETGKYNLDLKPEQAFGARNRKLIKIMPVGVFKKHDMIPQQGMMFSFDNLIGKISAVSGGRVIVDFNNPLAGKEVFYELNVKRIINDIKEKVKTLISSFFRTELEFEINEKKLIIKADKNLKTFVDFFKPKFKEILDLDLEASESKDSDSTHKSAISDIEETKQEEKKEEKEENKKYNT